MNVKDKVALVTGAARGLGKAYAEALLKRGAKVAITDISMEEGQATANGFRHEYGEDRVMFVSGDLTKQDEIEAIFLAVDSTFGTLDILINNAGIATRNPLKKSFDVNVFTMVCCCDLAMARMDKTKGGKGGVIVNISSLAGIMTMAGCPVYHASKHAAAGYTGSQGKVLAKGGSGIRMVGLCPGFVKTALTQRFQDAEAAGDASIAWSLKHCGGWVDMSYVVRACMNLIEKTVPSGSLVRVDNIKGIKMVIPEEAPCVELP